MLVRFPRIDYSRVRPAWAPNRECVLGRNATSTIPTCIRPGLIKMMKPAPKLSLRYFLPPFYACAKKRPPRGMREYLTRFGKAGDVGREPLAAG